MKKILVSVVAIVAALSLTACLGGKEETVTKPAELAAQFNKGEIPPEELEDGLALWNESIKED